MSEKREPEPRNVSKFTRRDFLKISGGLIVSAAFVDLMAACKPEVQTATITNTKTLTNTSTKTENSTLTLTSTETATSTATKTTTMTATSTETVIPLHLKIGTTKAPDTFNQCLEGGSYGKGNYNSFCAAPFAERDENGIVLPFIMTAWEIAEDNKSMIATFATDKGITFHDGQPLTMDDIIFSFNFLKNVLKVGYVKELDHFEKIDERKLKFYFVDSAYAFLQSIAKTVYVYPKHIWENIAEPKKYTGADATIGCGPYKYTGCDQDAQTIYFEAVDNYFKGELTVKKVSVRSFGSQDALIMALRNGEVDAMYDYSASLDPSAAPSITGIAGLDPGMCTNPGNFLLAFGFNKTPTNDLNFRTAVSYALDYSLLATTIGGVDGEIPCTGLIPPPNVGFDASLPKLRQDIELAKATLDAAGYIDINGDGYRELPNGEPMNVMVNPQYVTSRQALYLRMAEIIMSNLNDIGIKTTLDEESLKNSDYFTQMRTDGSYELHIVYSSTGSAFFRTAFMYMVKLTENYNSDWGTCNIPEVTETYYALRTVKNVEEYEEYAREMQRLAGKYVIGLALCWDKTYFPYRTDKYAGWIYFPGYGPINSKTWYSVTEK